MPPPGRRNPTPGARRLCLALASAVALTAIPGCIGRGGSDPAEDPQNTWRGPACDLRPEWMRRIQRGTKTGKSREHDLVVVPREPHYVGDLTNAGHSGVADRLHEIPLVLYGPGHIRGRGEIRGRATLASIAPTLAELLDFDLDDAAEPPLREALVDNPDRPRLIVTAVVDGGGWNVLKKWPRAWPNIKDLMERGTSFVDATVGSSPSITPASHTTLGTGVYPNRHGVTGIVVRNDRGRMTGAFTKTPRVHDEGIDPAVSIKRPTLAELFDRAEDNEPKVALVGFANFITGMIGRGSGFPGGDKDVVAFINDDRWVTVPEFFALPKHIAGRDPKMERDLAKDDLIDGLSDGKWRGHDIEPLTATPTFSRMVARALGALVKREEMGADDVPDLIFTNFKSPDSAGHLWNMLAPEQEDAIASVDEAVAKLIRMLDSEVGRGNWVFVLTADHGQTPLSDRSWPISMAELRADVDAELDQNGNDTSLFEYSSNAMLFVNREELEDNGLTAEELASFISTYRIRDNVAKGGLPAAWRERADERLFSAAFPIGRLQAVAGCVPTSKMPDDGS